MTHAEPTPEYSRDVWRQRILKALNVRGLAFQRVMEVEGPHVRVGDEWVLSFALTHYLGLGQHPLVSRSIAIASQSGVSLGMPGAIGVSTLSNKVEAAIASLTGQQAAMVFPSTTHAAIDALSLLTGRSGSIALDERAYPISVQAAHLATMNGGKVYFFRHNDLDSLERILASSNRRSISVIACDGVYPDSGRLAPLRQLDQLAREYQAMVYVDDAHGFGLLGSHPALDMPLGLGGGGAPAWLGIRPGHLVHAGGLAKAFGIPLAFVAGPRPLIDNLRTAGSTSFHSSPPSLPVLAAALTALMVHAEEGDNRRHRIARLVRRFRSGLLRAGFEPTPASAFPIQSLQFDSGMTALRFATDLRRKGIWPVMQVGLPNVPEGGTVRFVLSALHQDEDIDKAVHAIVTGRGTGAASASTVRT